MSSANSAKKTKKAIKVKGKSQTNPTAEQKKAANQKKKIMRFVIDERGHLVYASKTFKTLLKTNLALIETQHANDYLVLEDEEAYLPHNPIALASSGKDPKDFSFIRPGCHTLQIQTGKTKTSKYHFQFDWVSTPDGKNYLVATNESISEVPEVSNSLKRLILQINGLQDNDNAAPEKNNEISGKNLARLKESEYALFTQMSNELHSTLEHDGEFIRFNRNFARLMGYEDSDLLGRNFIDFIHADDKANVRNTFYTISQPGRASSFSPSIGFETRMVGKEGGLFWIEWQFKNVDGIVYALGKDVTDIKNNENILKKKETQLKEAQSLAQMGHWRWEIDTEKLEWSDEIYAIFGKSPSCFHPDINNLYKLLHRRDIARVIQAFQRAIIEKRNYDIDFRIYKNDGEPRYINCEGRCELNEDDEVIALFGIMQDVTERLQHERALQEAKEAAENAYAAKSRFLANMSHELRTPLNAIIGFSEMMQRQLLGPLGNEKYLDYMAGIRESGEHLLDLISDILDMAKIEAGKYELDPERLNISKICRLAVHMMEGRATDAGIKLDVNIDNEDETIEADRRAIMQILLNLLSNAIKFTQTGGTVDVCVKSIGDDICLSVIDSGIGIPEHKIASITKPFEQVENEYSRNHQGSGLGLAITKDLTDLHNGKLEIISSQGEGTTVKILLPKVIAT